MRQRLPPDRVWMSSRLAHSFHPAPTGRHLACPACLHWTRSARPCFNFRTRERSRSSHHDLPPGRRPGLHPACGAPALSAAGDTATGAAQLPPGFTLTRTGDIHDFEYFAGGWRTRQHRLKERGAGSTAWDDFPATLCAAVYLNGIATAGEMWVPSKNIAGLTVRAFDLGKRQWSVHWVSSRSGTMDSGMFGGFGGSHGEFYGEDTEGGRPVKVRFPWDKIDHDHAHWEQAFSFDNRTWETNWTADFTRAESARVCSAPAKALKRAGQRCPAPRSALSVFPARFG
jgi:hypothetical protein